MWLDIEGYEGKYAVSEDGQVLSWRYGKTNAPKLLAQSNTRGYLRVCLCKPNQKDRLIAVHTLVANAFIGPRPPGLTINHIDGIKANNTPWNLEYVTQSDNAKHAFRLGLRCSNGEMHSRAKLDDEKVRLIRKLVEAGETQLSVAMRFGVTQSSISHVVARKRWSHVIDCGGVF